jgi:hypothetical protein
MMRAFLAAGVAVGVLALAACGGGDEEDSAAGWADSVCTSIGDWRADVQGTVDEFRNDPASLSADSLREATDDTVESTEALVDELRELGPPDTESGEEARAEIEELAESLESSRDSVEETLEGSTESVSGVLANLSAITAELQAAASAAAATFERLLALDPSGELAQAFRDVDSCVALQE